MIEGKLFQVEKLDFEGRKAYVRAVDCDYYTDAITYTRVTILDASRPSRSARSTRATCPTRKTRATRVTCPTCATRR